MVLPVAAIPRVPLGCRRLGKGLVTSLATRTPRRNRSPPGAPGLLAPIGGGGGAKRREVGAFPPTQGRRSSAFGSCTRPRWPGHSRGGGGEWAGLARTLANRGPLPQLS